MIIEWIHNHAYQILTVLGCVLLFLVTLIVQGWHSYRKKGQVRGRRTTTPRSPSGEHYKLVDIGVYEVAGREEPEVVLYFYTEEKFIVACNVMEALYKLLKSEDFYDYDTFDSFVGHMNHYVTLRDKRNRTLADKLRKTAKRKK